MYIIYICIIYLYIIYIWVSWVFFPFLLFNHYYKCTQICTGLHFSGTTHRRWCRNVWKCFRGSSSTSVATEILSALKLRSQMGAAQRKRFCCHWKGKNHEHQGSGNTSKITFSSRGLWCLKLLVLDAIVILKKNPNYWWENLKLISKLLALNKNWCWSNHMKFLR